MDYNLLYTFIIIAAFITCLCVQIKLLKAGKWGFRFLIPISIALAVYVIWVANGYHVMECLPITIVLLFFCLVNLFVTFIFTLSQKR